ncbi:hypothetical protein [Anaerovorax odorimutans]|uniref:hypothetical protein n=1 Tax=Anaerovorax odorimutans TaxID=109327 RepID=UPI0003FB60A9|nr:hypothetical protein [Anaerovorax odorimutans]
MGMKMFVASGVFNPADYGLKVGDMLDVICVGGGQGGGHEPYYGGSGATSSFGNIVSAVGGSPNGGQYINDNTSNVGGCGGFILGVNDWGGLPTSIVAGTYAPSRPSVGSAGANSPSHARNKYEGVSFGGGNTGYGQGGGGYGAGGGGGSNYSGTYGGNSGKVEYATHKLTTLVAITVSVGGGGAGASDHGNGASGTITGGGIGDADAGNGGYNNVGGGDEAYGGGGAGGCVIVFW